MHTRMAIKVNLLDFVGILNKEEAEKLEKAVREGRDLSRKRFVRSFN